MSKPTTKNPTLAVAIIAIVMIVFAVMCYVQIEIKQGPDQQNGGFICRSADNTCLQAYETFVQGKYPHPNRAPYLVVNAE
jgi:hypothetical protein